MAYKVRPEINLNPRTLLFDPKWIDASSEKKPYKITIGAKPVTVPLAIIRRGLKKLVPGKAKSFRLAKQEELKYLYERGMRSLISKDGEESDLGYSIVDLDDVQADDKSIANNGSVAKVAADRK